MSLAVRCRSAPCVDPSQLPGQLPYGHVVDEGYTAMYIATMWILLAACPVEDIQEIAAGLERLHQTGVSVKLSASPCGLRYARCSEVPRRPRLAPATERTPEKRFLTVMVPPAGCLDHLEKKRTLAFATSDRRRDIYIEELGLILFRHPLRLTDDYRFADVVQDILKLPADVSSISCPFTGLDDPQLAMLADRFKSVVCLELGANPITDTGIQKLAELKSLRVLDLSDTLITDQGLKELKHVQSLTSLSVAGCQVCDSEVAALIRELPNLEMIFLHHTDCASATTMELLRHGKVKTVDLSNTKVDDAAVRMLLATEPLEEAFLDGNNISDAALTHIALARNLRLLSVRGTKISDEAIRRIRSGRLKVVKDIFPIPDKCLKSGA